MSMARLLGPFCTYGTIRKEGFILRLLLGGERTLDDDADSGSRLWPSSSALRRAVSECRRNDYRCAVLAQGSFQARIHKMEPIEASPTWLYVQDDLAVY